jgi:hypothetical protein
MGLFVGFEVLFQGLASAVCLVAVTAVVVKGCLIGVFTTAVAALVLSAMLNLANMAHVLDLTFEVESAFMAKRVTCYSLVTL